MYQKKSNRWMMLKALFIIPVACFALYTFANPKADSPIPQVKKTAVTQQKKTVAAQAKKVTSDDKIYDIGDVNAGFPGGDEACIKWLEDNLKYPQDAIGKRLQGRVIVELVINKDGSFAEVRALRGPAKELCDEAVRVVKEMPKWNPAKVKGEVVRSSFRLPINFRLQ